MNMQQFRKIKHALRDAVRALDNSRPVSPSEFSARRHKDARRQCDRVSCDLPVPRQITTAQITDIASETYSTLKPDMDENDEMIAIVSAVLLHVGVEVTHD